MLWPKFVAEDWRPLWRDRVLPDRASLGDEHVTFRIAVLQLPGVNCEPESRRALELAGLEAEIVRWTRRDLADFDGYLIPGGFSFQDRVRGGAVAAREPVMEAVVEAAAAGKPVLGICNGAQVLVESGLVPGIEPGRVEMALAPNRMTGRRGYYCRWVHLRLDDAGTAASCAMAPGTISPIPIAHAEGRFTTRDPEVARALTAGQQVVWRYSRADGVPAAGFPANPNGSLGDIAGLRNPAGNVVAMMPHPERATLIQQLAWELEGPWGERRRDARGESALAEPGPGFGVFESVRLFLERRAALAMTASPEARRTASQMSPGGADPGRSR